MAQWKLPCGQTVRYKLEDGSILSSGSQSKLARLSQMNWDEIRTRAGQEFHKRSDLARYRMGSPPATVPFHDAKLRRPEFFFPAGVAKERSALLVKHLPSEATETLHQADDIRRHHFHLLGYEDLDY